MNTAQEEEFDRECEISKGFSRWNQLEGIMKKIHIRCIIYPKKANSTVRVSQNGDANLKESASALEELRKKIWSLSSKLRKDSIIGVSSPSDGIHLTGFSG